MSIDKKQLCNSICGYYGSDKIDSDEYLRRFIDIEYKLPEPEYKDYLKYLFEIYRLGDYYKLPKRYNSYELRFNEEQYYSFMSEYCKAKGISLRQLEKIFAHTRIVTNIFNTGEYANPILVTYLITIKCINPLLYEKITKFKLDIQELVTELENDLKDGFNKDCDQSSSFTFNILLISVLYSYLTVYKRIYNMKFSLVDEQSNLTFNIMYADKAKLINFIEKPWRELEVNINHYVNKINLLENFRDE